MIFPSLLMITENVLFGLDSMRIDIREAQYFTALPSKLLMIFVKHS